MMHSSRRSALKLLGGAAVAATTLTTGALPAAAQAEDLFVAQRYENFKRGTIHSLDPATRGMVVVWKDMGRVKMKAADLVVRDTSGNSYASLKVGQECDIHWYDYVDFLVAKTTPQVTERAKKMVASGARIEGIPGSQQQIRLFTMSGMVVRTLPDTNMIYIINASGGEPDRPAPDSGEVIQMPQVVSAEGDKALDGLKPGDHVTMVYSVQTAIRVKIIR